MLMGAVPAAARPAPQVRVDQLGATAPGEAKISNTVTEPIKKKTYCYYRLDGRDFDRPISTGTTVSASKSGTTIGRRFEGSTAIAMAS